jgi:hypothetical protein
LKNYCIEIGKKISNLITINGDSINNKNHYDLVSKLYLAALESLDRDIVSQFNANENHKYSPFLSCLTYDIYRDDGIKDTVLNYFIISIVNHFSLTSSVDVIFYQYPGKTALKHLNSIENVSVVLKVDTLIIRKRWIRNTFGPLKVLFRYFKVMVSIETGENSDFTKAVSKHVFLTNLNTTQSRWKGYPNALQLKKEQAYFLDVDLRRCKIITGNTQIQLKLFNTRNFLKALNESSKIVWALNQDLNAITSIFQEEVKSQSFLQTLTVVWRFYAWQELFVKYGVTDIHVMTTFGDPFKRLPLAVAKISGATGHIFACRPYLSNYRSEDRIITNDKIENYICQIPPEIIVLDEYSQNQLKKVGVVASIYNPISKSIKFSATDGLLLLFSDFAYNEEIIKLVCKLKVPKINLFIREHPLEKLKDYQKEKLKFTGNSIIDLNQYDWSELQFENVLTFSANTTAGLDAVTCGCDLLWLPFLSQNFLQFAGYAKDTGKVVFNENEWFIAVTEYLKTK